MMTPQMLDRATDAFRRGYRDAYAGREPATLTAGTFAAHDYAEGYAAAEAEIRRYGR
jgi:hypothetical protein